MWLPDKTTKISIENFHGRQVFDSMRLNIFWIWSNKQGYRNVLLMSLHQHNKKKRSNKWTIKYWGEFSNKDGYKEIKTC